MFPCFLSALLHRITRAVWQVGDAGCGSEGSGQLAAIRSEVDAQGRDAQDYSAIRRDGGGGSGFGDGGHRVLELVVTAIARVSLTREQRHRSADASRTIRQGHWHTRRRISGELSLASA